MAASTDLVKSCTVSKAMGIIKAPSVVQNCKGNYEYENYYKIQKEIFARK